VCECVCERESERERERETERERQRERETVFEVLCLYCWPVVHHLFKLLYQVHLYSVNESIQYCKTTSNENALFRTNPFPENTHCPGSTSFRGDAVVVRKHLKGFCFQTCNVKQMLFNVKEVL